MYKYILFFIAVVSFPLFANQKYIVKVPITDLRIEPIPSDKSGKHDALQDTQALLGDPLEFLEEKDEWIKVNVLTQSVEGWVEKRTLQRVDDFPEYNLVVSVPWTNIYVSVPIGSHPQGFLMPASLGTYLQGIEDRGERWKVAMPDGKIGYVMTSDIRLLEKLSEDEVRKGIIESGNKLVGNPYYWGGASAYKDPASWSGPASGVDCSGLVYLLYKAYGMKVPRNSTEQYTFSNKDISSLKPGDLLFFAKPETGKVHHVMIYVENDLLLESPETGSSIRFISATDRIGKPIDQITPGEIINDRIIYFGSMW